MKLELLRCLLREIADSELSGDAKSGSRGSATLADNFSQTGTMTLPDSIDLNNPFTLSFSFNITESAGASDVDGPGGDGIFVRIAFDSSLFEVAFDTFKNFENVSGNEINVKFNGAVLAAVAIQERMNNGEKHGAVIDSDGDVLTIELDGEIVLAQPLIEIQTSGNDLSSGVLTISGVTGSAMGTHVISSVSLRS